VIGITETTVLVDRGSSDRTAEAVAVAAITDAAAPAKSVGSAHGAAMNAGNREGSERPADDGVSLWDSGRDTVKGEGQRSEEQPSWLLL
jgi:hypothetical protein